MRFIRARQMHSVSTKCMGVLISASMGVGILSQQAAAVVGAGDLAIIGYNSANPDEFRIVFLSSASASDTVSFTDNGWLSSGSFRTGEGSLTYTVQTGGISAGSTVNWANGQSISGTGWSGNNPTNFAFNASGDSLIAYTGTLGSPSLVYGLQQGTAWNANATSAATSAEPGTLVSGVTTGLIGGANGYYAGMTSGTKALLQVAIGNVTNWTSSSSAVSSSNFASSFSIGSSASLAWDSNGGTAGTGGTGTWDSTTSNRFSNSANTTFFRWVNSSTGNDHTAVFGGTAGTVSVGAGGVTASGLQFDTTGYTIQNNTVNLSATSTPAINVTSGASTTITSAITSTGGLSKTGDGALTLGGTSGYTGSTSVSAGSLFVNGSLSNTSSTTVSDLATLGGNGSIANGVSVASGGTIVVGTSDLDTSIGTFTLGSLALSGLLEVGATGALTYDKLITTGAFSVTGGTIAFRTSGYTVGYNTSFDLADFTGSASGATFDFSGASVQQYGAWDTSAFASSGVVTYVPEPGAALLGGLGLLMLLRRRR